MLLIAQNGGVGFQILLLLRGRLLMNYYHGICYNKLVYLFLVLYGSVVNTNSKLSLNCVCGQMKKKHDGQSYEVGPYIAY